MDITIEPGELVTLDELAATLEWELDDDEKRLAQGSLEDLSEDARMYGKSSWTTATNAPRQVKSLIRRAVAKHLRNPDGFTTSRAGDETVGWTDRAGDMGSLQFTEREIKMLRQIAGTRSLHSVEIYAHRRTPPNHVEGLVPTDTVPFPLYVRDGTPW